MIGVVVWANEIREKAIIWCEDQATLAYLQGRENLADDRKSWPMPGDLVELETEMLGSLRHARAVSLISEQYCPDLPRMLTAAEPARADVTRLRVVGNGDARRSSSTLPAEKFCTYPRSGAAS